MPKRYHKSSRKHGGMRSEYGESSRKDGHNRDEYENQSDRHPNYGVGEERSKHHGDRFNDEMKHDRGDERAVYRKFRAMGDASGFYAGMEPRRRQEMEDAGMIHEDQSKIANLPQYVMIKEYPKVGPYLSEGLEDSIAGVDHQMDYDDGKRREHFYPKKV